MWSMSYALGFPLMARLATESWPSLVEAPPLFTRSSTELERGIDYFTLLYTILYYFIWLYITWHYFTLFYITLYDFTLLDVTLHYFILLYMTLHYLTLLYIFINYLQFRIKRLISSQVIGKRLFGSLDGALSLNISIPGRFEARFRCEVTWLNYVWKMPYFLWKQTVFPSMSQYPHWSAGMAGVCRQQVMCVQAMKMSRWRRCICRWMSMSQSQTSALGPIEPWLSFWFVIVPWFPLVLLVYVFRPWHTVFRLPQSKFWCQPLPSPGALGPWSPGWFTEDWTMGFSMPKIFASRPGGPEVERSETSWWN